MISSSKSAPGTHCCWLLQCYSTANRTLTISANKLRYWKSRTSRIIVVHVVRYTLYHK